jgi:hypothetical protein
LNERLTEVFGCLELCDYGDYFEKLALKRTQSVLNEYETEQQ